MVSARSSYRCTVVCSLSNLFYKLLHMAEMSGGLSLEQYTYMMPASNLVAGHCTIVVVSLQRDNACHPSVLAV